MIIGEAMIPNVSVTLEVRGDFTQGYIEKVTMLKGGSEIIKGQPLRNNRLGMLAQASLWQLELSDVYTWHVGDLINSLLIERIDEFSFISRLKMDKHINQILLYCSIHIIEQNYPSIDLNQETLQKLSNIGAELSLHLKMA